MINLTSRAINHISSLVKMFQIKHFLAVVLVGFLLLTTNVNIALASESSNPAATKRVEQLVHQNDSSRPKTTGEWNKEARETEGSPGKRLQKIAGESGQALKEFGKVYPDTAKRSSGDLND